MKKIFTSIFVFILLTLSSCAGCTHKESNEPNKKTIDDIQAKAYGIGYADGIAHAEFNSENEYEQNSPEEAAYLLGYKEGYNKGQDE